MAENRRTRRVKAKAKAKQKSAVVKTTRARKSYVRKQELEALGSDASSGHYEKGSKMHNLLTKRSAAAKKRATQARKSTGPRKLKK